MSYVLLARDSDRFVLGGRVRVLDKDLQIEWAELQLLEENIKFARTNNWTKLDFESDCVSLVNRFNKMNTDITTLGYCVQETYRLLESFYYFNFNWVPRCCNKVVDHLCKWVMEKNCTWDFNVDYPSDIHKSVLNDAIN